MDHFVGNWVSHADGDGQFHACTRGIPAPAGKVGRADLTVAELIAALQQLPADADVLVWLAEASEWGYVEHVHLHTNADGVTRFAVLQYALDSDGDIPDKEATP